MNHLPLPAKKLRRYPGLLLDIAGRWMEVAPYYGDIYDFNSDGTGYCYYEDGDYSYFEWEADNYYLTLYFTNGYEETVEYYSWSFQGNSLYLYPNYDTSNPLVLKPY